MTDRMVWLCLLLVGVVAMGGCGGEDSDTSSNGDAATPTKTSASAAAADTPKAAVLNFIKAVETGDKDLFLNSLSYDENDEDIITAMFGVFSAGQKMQTKALDAYGPEGAKALVQDNSFPTAAEIDEKVTIEESESGDTAKATIPEKNKPLDLVKVDGVWKVSLPSAELPPAEQREQTMKMMTAMAAAMNTAAENIGKEGYSAEKVQEEMNTAMQKAMMEAMQQAQPTMDAPAADQGDQP